jgi:hypothetical protein
MRGDASLIATGFRLRSGSEYRGKSFATHDTGDRDRAARNLSNGTSIVWGITKFRIAKQLIWLLDRCNTGLTKRISRVMTLHRKPETVM